MDSVELISRLKELDRQALVLEKEADGLKVKAKEHEKSAESKRAEAVALLRQYDGPQLELEIPAREEVIVADPDCPLCHGRGTVEEDGAQVTCACLIAAFDRQREKEGIRKPVEEGADA